VKGALLDAAAELLAERGPKGVSVRDVSARTREPLFLRAK
jgi:AcrR family transcriptional regulator